MIFRSARLAAALALCLAAAAASIPAATATQPATVTWTGLRSATRVVDLAGPTAQGSILVSANGRLDTLTAGGGWHQFAPGFSGPAGLENYMALSSGQPVPGAGCSWPAGELYVVHLAGDHGLTEITPHGRVSHFVSLPASQGLENGIAFDLTGRFGHRLLVTQTKKLQSGGYASTLSAVSCDGKVQVLTRDGPRVEGGMVVAPASFGRFAGDLLSPDEYSHDLYAFAPNGHTSVVVQTNVPIGGDTGIESLGVVPATYTRALVSDRNYTPDKSHPGDNLILSVTQAALNAAGVRPGDVLAVAEAGAKTVVVTCASTCQARDIGVGPPKAHVEGHVVFSDANL